MDGADEVWPGSSGEFEGEFSLAVGLGVGGDFHGGGEVDENDFVSGGGLVGGAVGDGAGEGLGGGRGEGQREDRGQQYGLCGFSQKQLLRICEQRQRTPVDCNMGDLSTVDVPTSSVLRKTLRVFEQIDNVVHDMVNFAKADDAPSLERKYPFTHPLQLQPRSP